MGKKNSAPVKEKEIVDEEDEYHFMRLNTHNEDRAPTTECRIIFSENPLILLSTSILFGKSKREVPLSAFLPWKMEGKDKLWIASGRRISNSAADDEDFISIDMLSKKRDSGETKRKEIERDLRDRVYSEAIWSGEHSPRFFMLRQKERRDIKLYNDDFLPILEGGPEGTNRRNSYKKIMKGITTENLKTLTLRDSIWKYSSKTKGEFPAGFYLKKFVGAVGAWGLVKEVGIFPREEKKRRREEVVPEKPVGEWILSTPQLKKKPKKADIDVKKEK
jgi:hypothetical protein